MIRITLTLFALYCVGILASCSQSPPTAPAPSQPIRPKNVILMIGDGMGVTQVSTAFYHGDTVPNFARFKVVGLSQTSSKSHKITDSAAGATAFSAGQRTYNGAIGVGADSAALPLITELLTESRQMATGIVATSTITHATPASFFAHVDFRWKEEEIASWMHRSPIDFAAGAGLEYFADRQDGLNFLDSLTAAGFTIDTNAITTPESGGKYAYLFTSPGERGNGMPKMSERRGDFLPKATQSAIHVLSQDPNGFFLMVEGSQIDWGGHANDGPYIRDETWDFDQVLGDVLDWAEKDGETLVVVTADHETGGFALVGAPKFGKADYDQIVPAFSTGGHSAALVPVFAYGPGAEDFGGIYNNTDIFHKIMALLKEE